MKNLEHKSLNLEFKDLDTSKRTAVIAHAVYSNIDRTKDIAEKGMFTKSWQENDDIGFFLNHKPELVIGNTLKTFDDDKKAYTEVKFGNWTLGNDILEMADAKVLKGASFGYVVEKKSYEIIKGEKIRRLKEVKHIETSLLHARPPANPLAGIVTLTKAFDGLELKSLSPDEQTALKSILTSDQSALIQLVSLSSNLDVTSDLFTWINYNISQRASLIGDIRSQLKYNCDDMMAMKSYATTMEKFCRNSKASDECIKSIQNELEEAKQIISDYDTAGTHVADEQAASKNERKAFADSLFLLSLKTFN